MPIAPTTRMPDRTGDCELFQRRGWDSNPRWTKRPTTVFETAPFNHSGTPPGDGSPGAKASTRPGRGRLAPVVEEVLQERARVVGQQAARDLRPVVQPWLAQHVEHTAGGAGLRV